VPRKKSFETVEAIRAARDRFWRHGYAGTSLSDLEEATGLNRSSLYQAFGTKRDLFARALDNYLDEVALPRLAPLEAPGAGPDAVAAYFRGLTGLPPHLGCLMVNTITELGPHDEAAHTAATAYRLRVRHAFRNALGTGEAAERRAELLTGTLVGLLATARLSRTTAARLARDTAAEIDTWAQ
jgi:TetR/AcrR family transcriptional repressor of nem operon